LRRAGGKSVLRRGRDLRARGERGLLQELADSRKSPCRDVLPELRRCDLHGQELPGHGG
jgi:hypothetical protein